MQTWNCEYFSSQLLSLGILLREQSQVHEKGDVSIPDKASLWKEDSLRDSWIPPLLPTPKRSKPGLPVPTKHHKTVTP